MKPKQKKYFTGTNIQISVSGERYLGAVVGSDEYRMKYCRKTVEWTTEIKLLAEITITHPQAVCACYVSRYQHKFTYYQWTILGIEDYLIALEEIIRNTFSPSIAGRHIINDEERILFSLHPQLDGMRIKIPADSALIELPNSNDLTKPLQATILRKEGDGERKTRQQIKLGEKHITMKGWINFDKICQIKIKDWMILIT